MRKGVLLGGGVMLVGALLVGVPTRAATTRAEATTRVTAPARLASLVQARVISDAAHGRDPFTVGVEFRMAPGWHIYWKNPGDAGLAPRLRWRLPEGYTASEPYFPVPRRITSAGVVDYGYSGSAMLFVTITPPRDARAQDQPAITLDADWLVCKEECRPGRVSLAFSPGAQSASELASARQRLRAAQRALPGSLNAAGLQVESVSFEPGAGGAALVVRLAGPRAAAATDFYPEAIPGWDIRYGEITVRGGIIRIPLRPSSSPPPRAIRGLVIDPAGAYTLVSTIP